MRAQVIGARYIRQEGKLRRSYRQGVEIEVTAAELERHSQLLRSIDNPPPAEELGEAGSPRVVWEEPKSHAEADAQAAALGVSFPPKTKLGAKVAALEELRAAQPGE